MMSESLRRPAQQVVPGGLGEDRVELGVQRRERLQPAAALAASRPASTRPAETSHVGVGAALCGEAGDEALQRGAELEQLAGGAASIEATRAPRRGSISTNPSDDSVRRASRIGLRDTSKRAAISSSTRRSPWT